MSENSTSKVMPAVDFDDNIAPANSADGPHLYPVIDNDQDFFVEKNGLRFAGTHLLIELWGAKRLDDPAHIEVALREAAMAAGATVLHTHLHHFTPNQGVSGVVVLAESHISIHTWPEHGYAAIDVFMCGTCDPYKAVPVLRSALFAENIQINEQKRGIIL